MALVVCVESGLSPGAAWSDLVKVASRARRAVFVRDLVQSFSRASFVLYLVQSLSRAASVRYLVQHI